MRTNGVAVKEGLARNYDDKRKPSLVPYMRAAHLMTNRLQNAGLNRDITIDEDTLTEIELWLSCWFYTQMDPLYKAKNTGGASGTYQDHGYDRMAIALDPTGLLAGLLAGKTQQAGAVWLGKTEGEQRTYDQRN